MNNYMSDPFVLGADGRTCTGNAETKDWVHFWEVQVTAYKENLTTWNAGSMLTDVQEDMFLQGKIGMTEAAMGDAFAAAEQGLNVGLTGQPVVTKGWQGNVGGWNTSYNIMSATKHPEEAWQFLKFMSTEVPLMVPVGADALNAGGGGLPGLPCYLPLLKDPKIQEMVNNNSLVADAVKLMQRIKVPPFTPAIWTSTNSFNDGFTAMTEQDVPVIEALHTSAQECQDVTDQEWSTFEAILK
jgi:ABC-type glycerol-3-phosphate transport system substrate-binding protein